MIIVESRIIFKQVFKFLQRFNEFSTKVLFKQDFYNNSSLKIKKEGEK